MQIESSRYCGFTSYGKGQVATLKPGIYNQYNKDVYNQVSQYHSREIPYFDDKLRYKSVYNSELLNMKKTDYNENRKKLQMKIDLDNYQYSHDPNVIEVLKEGTQKNEELTRSM